MTFTRSLFGLIFSVLLLTTLSAAHAQQMVSIDRPEVNMRAGASTRHPTLWTLSAGYPLQVLSRQGQWYKVRDFESDEGWVYAPLTARKPHHIVKSKIVNIRSGPSTRHRIVGKAEYGEVLRTLKRQSQWVRVRTSGGSTGWVAKRLLWGW